VGVDGRVKACQIIVTSGSPILDGTTCGLLMQRAEFKPALDANGNPTEGVYSSRINWVIPKHEPTAIKPESMVRSFTIETDGTATNCSEYKNGHLVQQSVTQAPCGTATKFEPLVDRNGVPVRKLVTIKASVEISDAP
jgi:hypothetical protein